MKACILFIIMILFLPFKNSAQEMPQDSVVQIEEDISINESSEMGVDIQTPIDPITQLIIQGDSLSDLGDHEGAAEVFLQVLKIDSNHYEASWKVGEQLTDVANNLPDHEKKQKEDLFQKAVQYCEKAIEIQSNGWEGHFRLSVAMGRLALFRGGKEKINLSKRIKAEADQAVSLNPQADLAYHVLGRWHQNLANLSWILKSFAKILYGGVPPGSNEEAVAMFQKAIEIDPNHIEHHLELARTFQYMGKKELMHEPLEKVLALPAVEEDDDQFKAEAEEMLKKIK